MNQTEIESIQVARSLSCSGGESICQASTARPFTVQRCLARHGRRFASNVPTIARVWSAKNDTKYERTDSNNRWRFLPAS